MCAQTSCARALLLCSCRSRLGVCRCSVCRRPVAFFDALQLRRRNGTSCAGGETLHSASCQTGYLTIPRPLSHIGTLLTWTVVPWRRRAFHMAWLLIFRPWHRSWSAGVPCTRTFRAPSALSQNDLCCHGTVIHEIILTLASGLIFSPCSKGWLALC